MSQILVSIIVPAFNAQKTIKKCLQSLLSQNFSSDSFEIIVVDNNSTDQSPLLIKEFPGVHYFLEKKQGRAYARNSGAKMARGEWLAFIDADVTLDPDWLKTMVNAFSTSFIGAGQGRIIPVDDDGQASLNQFRIRAQEEATDKSNIILKLMYAESPMVNSAACMYRRFAFLFVGGFDEHLERHEDIDLAKRVCVAGFDLVAVPEARAFVEYHGEGWWSYFVRSFDEGVTKQCYNKKWEQYFSNRSALLESDATKKKALPDSFIQNLYMVRNEIVYNVIKSIVYFDFYFFLKAINSSFKAMGRVWGILKKDYPQMFMPKVHSPFVHRGIVLNNNRAMPIEEDLRFVFENGALLYALNVSNNKIVDLSHCQSLCRILEQKVLLGSIDV